MVPVHGHILSFLNSQSWYLSIFKLTATSSILYPSENVVKQMARCAPNNYYTPYVSRLVHYMAQSVHSPSANKGQHYDVALLGTNHFVTTSQRSVIYCYSFGTQNKFTLETTSLLLTTHIDQLCAVYPCFAVVNNNKIFMKQ